MGESVSESLDGDMEETNGVFEEIIDKSMKIEVMEDQISDFVSYDDFNGNDEMEAISNGNDENDTEENVKMEETVGDVKKEEIFNQYSFINNKENISESRVESPVKIKLKRTGQFHFISLP